MSGINNKFIYLKRRSSFDEIIQNVVEDLNPIIFIEDTSQLYTCGTFFNLGYPDIKVSEISGQVKVDIGNEHFFLATTGDGLNIRKGDGNKIIINSSALTKIDTDDVLNWDKLTKVLSHKESGVNAGDYGQSTNAVNASILSIPNIVVDKYGHVVDAKTSNVQIRDYVDQIAVSSDDAERNILESYNEGCDVSNTSQVRKTNGLTYNDSLKRLSVEGGIRVGGDVEILTGDLKVINGTIIGNLQGDVSGVATPKIHLDENPEYGGASKHLYGHVTLQDDIPGVRPPDSSDNVQTTNTKVTAVAASPLMVWNAIDVSKRYTDENSVTINAITETEETVSVKNNLNLSDDFVVDDNNNLYLRWLEI